MAKNTTDEHRKRADYIIDLTGLVNPYNRQGSNSKSEFYIYNMGFLASYLASLAEEDPFILRRYKKHVEELYEQQRRSKRRSQ